MNDGFSTTSTTNVHLSCDSLCRKSLTNQHEILNSFDVCDVHRVGRSCSMSDFILFTFTSIFLSFAPSNEHLLDGQSSPYSAANRLQIATASMFSFSRHFILCAVLVIAHLPPSSSPACALKHEST